MNGKHLFSFYPAKTQKWNLFAACCSFSAIVARLWLDAAISSIEADCSSVAAEIVPISSVTFRVILRAFSAADKICLLLSAVVTASCADAWIN